MTLPVILAAMDDIQAGLNGEFEAQINQIREAAKRFLLSPRLQLPQFFEFDNGRVYIKDIWSFLKSSYAEPVSSDKDKAKWAQSPDILDRADIFVALMYNFSRDWDRICPRCMRWGYVHDDAYTPTDDQRWEKSGTCSHECEIKLSAYLSFKAMDKGRTLDSVITYIWVAFRKGLAAEYTELWKEWAKQSERINPRTKKVEMPAIPTKNIKTQCDTFIAQLEQANSLIEDLKFQMESKDYVDTDFNRFIIKATATVVIREASGSSLKKPPPPQNSRNKKTTKKKPAQIRVFPQNLFVPRPFTHHIDAYYRNLKFLLLEYASDTGAIVTTELIDIASAATLSFLLQGYGSKEYNPKNFLQINRDPFTEKWELQNLGDYPESDDILFAEEMSTNITLKAMGKQGIVAGTDRHLMLLKSYAAKFMQQVENYKAKHMPTREMRAALCWTSIEDYLVAESLARGIQDGLARSAASETMKMIQNHGSNRASVEAAMAEEISPKSAKKVRMFIRDTTNLMMGPYLLSMSDDIDIPPLLHPSQDRVMDDIVDPYKDKLALKTLLEAREIPFQPHAKYFRSLENKRKKGLESGALIESLWDYLLSLFKIRSLQKEEATFRRTRDAVKAYKIFLTKQVQRAKQKNKPFELGDEGMLELKKRCERPSSKKMLEEAYRAFQMELWHDRTRVGMTRDTCAALARTRLSDSMANALLEGFLADCNKKSEDDMSKIDKFVEKFVKEMHVNLKEVQKTEPKVRWEESDSDVTLVSEKDGVLTPPPDYETL